MTMVTHLVVSNYSNADVQSVCNS